MEVLRTLARWCSSTGTKSLGWTLVILGVLLLVLPGPGTLVLVAGVALLARHYAWAHRVLGPLRVRAVEAARYGVQTWFRIVMSFFGGLWLFAIGVLWVISPRIPQFDVLGIGFGPHLPAAGWGVGLSLMLSAAIAWALLVYSVRRWREPRRVISGGGRPTEPPQGR